MPAKKANMGRDADGVASTTHPSVRDLSGSSALFFRTTRVFPIGSSRAIGLGVRVTGGDSGES